MGCGEGKGLRHLSPNEALSGRVRDKDEKRPAVPTTDRHAGFEPMRQFRDSLMRPTPARYLIVPAITTTGQPPLIRGCHRAR
jgi:hypothetical protein